MPDYSEQDLKYARELREDIHREALEIVRKTRPDVTTVVDPHPAEDYFQAYWDYPGRWYTMVAIPSGYRSRKAFVDAIVRDTLTAAGPMLTDAEYRRYARPAPVNGDPDGADYARLTAQRQAPEREDDALSALLAGYPDIAVKYCIVKREGRYLGYESHRAALKSAWRVCLSTDEDGGPWQGSPALATGKRITVDELFSSQERDGLLSYRRAFLYPPHGNGYTGRDFVRVNAALFPNGTDGLEAYRWSTDWTEYFDEGREWWGTLCLTVYDESLDRFAVIAASATD